MNFPIIFRFRNTFLSLLITRNMHFHFILFQRKITKKKYFFWAKANEREISIFDFNLHNHHQKFNERYREGNSSYSQIIFFTLKLKFLVERIIKFHRKHTPSPRYIYVNLQCYGVSFGKKKTTAHVIYVFWSCNILARSHVLITWSINESILWYAF